MFISWFIFAEVKDLEMLCWLALIYHSLVTHGEVDRSQSTDRKFLAKSLSYHLYWVQNNQLNTEFQVVTFRIRDPIHIKVGRRGTDYHFMKKLEEMGKKLSCKKNKYLWAQICVKLEISCSIFPINMLHFLSIKDKVQYDVIWRAGASTEGSWQKI